MGYYYQPPQQLTNLPTNIDTIGRQRKPSTSALRSVQHSRGQYGVVPGTLPFGPSTTVKICATDGSSLPVYLLRYRHWRSLSAHIRGIRSGSPSRPSHVGTWPTKICRSQVEPLQHCPSQTINVNQHFWAPKPLQKTLNLF